MTQDQLSLVLLGAFWAGTSAVFTGMKNASEVRDRIVVGKVGADELPFDYLRRLLLWEWGALKAALCLVSLVLGLIILQLPSLGNSASTVSASTFIVVCRIAAGLPLFGAFFFVISGVWEGVLLSRGLKDLQEIREKESANAELPPRI